jgi:redox-sensitive bicupin YhaK (pirin superfamily)
MGGFTAGTPLVSLIITIRKRINFGILRVLNDDTVEAGMGFGTHPHNNMEIISIPLEGDPEHNNSGNEQ